MNLKNNTNFVNVGVNEHHVWLRVPRTVVWTETVDLLAYYKSARCGGTRFWCKIHAHCVERRGREVYCQLRASAGSKIVMG